jgi:hypothetical protein
MTSAALETANRIVENYSMIQSRANLIVEALNTKLYIAKHSQGFDQVVRDTLEREIWLRLRTMADEYLA